MRHNKKILSKLGAALLLSSLHLSAWAAPAVSLTAPANGGVYLAPASVTVQASATAESGRTISRVEFYANGVLVGSDATAAYRIAVSNLAAGSHSLTAKAIDSAGEETSSAPRTITVNAANSAPIVSLSQPPNNARYNIPVDVTLAVSVHAPEVNDRIAQVEYFLNGASMGVVTASPWRLVLPNVSPGAYTLSATATDALGASTTSSARSFTVHAVNTPPTAVLTSPPNNSTYFNPVTLELKANAASPETNGAVRKVEFFANGELIGADTDKPYAVSWANITPGVYSVTAKATDDLGAETVSAARTVTITAQNAPPTVTIASPANNSHYNGPTPVDVPVRINAAAPETNDAIQKVELFRNGTLAATLTSSPYTATLLQLPPGSYALTAIATDAQGAQTTSATRTVIVDALNRPPMVSFTSPANNSSVQLLASVTLSANANAGEVNGSVTQVELLVNGEPVGVDLDKPYSVLWTPTAAGSFTLAARATDNLGAVTTSAARTVTVTPRELQVYYIHTDHLNTPRLITNQAQQAVWRWDHAEPFGTYPANENPSGLGGFEFNLRESNYYFDKETNQHYAMLRDCYDPATGRFCQSDPIGAVLFRDMAFRSLAGLGLARPELDDLLYSKGPRYNHLYAYVGGNPISFNDPLGLDETLWNNTAGGRSRWVGPTNGNWGGRCWGGGQFSCGPGGSGTAPPTDSGDACYMTHDNCWDQCRNNRQCVAACDPRLVDELRDLPDDPRQWPQPPRPGTEGDSRRFRDAAIMRFR